MNETELSKFIDTLMSYELIIGYLKIENENLKQKLREAKCANQLNKG